MGLFNRFQGAIFGLGIGAAAKDAVDPVLETAKQTSWGQRAVRVLAPGTAAEAGARGLDTTQTFTSLKEDGTVEQSSAQGASAVVFSDDAKRQGYGAARYEALCRLAQSMPTVQQALELWNRGRITEGTVDTILARLGYPTGVRPALKSLAEVLPPVTDLVRFAVREVYNPPLRKALDLDEEFPTAVVPDAQRLGLSLRSIKDYWAAHWELPSYTQLAQMLFRGHLTPEEFSQALKALDYAPTWRPKLEAIARAIPTLTDMIRFSVREAYDDDAAREQGLDLDYPTRFTTEAAKHGLDATDAKRYWRAHWRYPSPTQAYTMLHRRIIDSGQLRALLKILDYPLPWRERLERISYNVPGRIDLRRMLAEGVIDREDVLNGYKDLGYTDLWAERLTDFAVKLAAKSDDPTGQTYVERARGQLWTRLHSSYLAGDTTQAQARVQLPRAGVPADQVEEVLTTWGYESEVIRARLTPAGWKKAWAKGVVNPATGLPTTKDDVIDELRSRGWPIQDIHLFLAE